MNGEVKSFRLNDPMPWKEFKAMPDDIKEIYIKQIREKYSAPDCHIAKMMGINNCTFSQTMAALGLSCEKRKGKDTKWDKDGFEHWVNNGVPVPCEEPVKVVAETEDIYEPVHHPEIKTLPKMDKPAAPSIGTLTFETNAQAALKAVGSILGDANVRLTVMWKVCADHE